MGSSQWMPIRFFRRHVRAGRPARSSCVGRSRLGLNESDAYARTQITMMQESAHKEPFVNENQTLVTPLRPGLQVFMIHE
eukprot:6191387-Pleurochrysis_carterae.AAC.3